MFHPMFLLLLIAPKQKNFCVTKDRVPLRGSAVRLAPALFVSKPPGCGALLLLRASPRPRKRQTAAPAPLRLFLPQAAPQLRSPPPIAVPPAPCGRAPRGGFKRKATSFTVNIQQEKSLFKFTLPQSLPLPTRVHLALHAWARTPTSA